MSSGLFLRIAEIFAELHQKDKFSTCTVEQEIFAIFDLRQFTCMEFFAIVGGEGLLRLKTRP